MSAKSSLKCLCEY